MTDVVRNQTQQRNHKTPLLERFHETMDQEGVQNPVRPKGEAGNLNSTKRGNALGSYCSHFHYIHIRDA